MTAMCALRAKYSGKEIDQEFGSVEPNERDGLLMLNASLKITVFKTFVSYSALVAQGVGGLNDQKAEIEERYKEIKDQPLPTAEAVEDLVLKMNISFAKSVLKDIILTNQDLIDSYIGGQSSAAATTK